MNVVPGHSVKECWHHSAGVIHTDFEKGFIRAECYRFEDIDALGSEQAIKEAGKLRLEGKNTKCRTVMSYISASMYKYSLCKFPT